MIGCRRPVALAIATVTLGSGCGSSLVPESTGPDDPPVFVPSPDAVAFGQFEVAAAPSGSANALRQIRQERFLPEDPSGTAGRSLVLAIRDIGRPNLTCSADGECAGIRLNSTGDFTNRLIVDLGRGARSLWLREGGVLDELPEPT